jgi:hypothetical protein
MASKNLDVGIKYTGDAKDFKKASADARREAQRLRKEAVQNSQEMERKFKGVAMSVAKVGAAFIIAQKAFKLYEAAMNSTEGSADKFEQQMGLLHGTVQGVMFTLFSGDWENLITNIKNTAEATRDLAIAEDKLAEAKARNQLTRGDLEVKLQSTKLAAAEETDPVQKRALLQDAIEIQSQITQLNQSEFQKRIDDQEAYYKKVFNADDKYWDFVKSNLVTIAKNYDVFYSQQEANEKRLTDLNYQASLGPLTDTQQKEREGLMMLLNLMGSYDRLQGELSKKGQWEQFLGFLGDLRTGAAEGDAALLRLTKQVTTLSKEIDKESKVKVDTDVFGSGYWEAQQQAALEYDKFIADQLTAGGLGLEYWQAQTEAAAEYDAFIKDMYKDENKADLKDQIETYRELAGLFETMFSAGVQGWDEFGKAALKAIEMMMVKLAAMGALYLALTFIPGFGEFMALVGKISGFANGNFIQGKLGSVKPAKIALEVSGRNLATVGARGSSSLSRLT